ncbi:hypothetical protein BDQ17DRAFT_1430828 [Cyathus striatus]|nr:hypothetical protein BDQ17DRAFT_1430828 [Cyathus striatus]
MMLAFVPLFFSLSLFLSALSGAFGYPSPPALNYTGNMFHFEPGLGACGFTNTSSQIVASVSQNVYVNFPGATWNPARNPICGEMAYIVGMFFILLSPFPFSYPPIIYTITYLLPSLLPSPVLLPPTPSTSPSFPLILHSHILTNNTPAKDGKAIIAQIVDFFTESGRDHDIGVSNTAFQFFAALEEGIVRGVKWDILV